MSSQDNISTTELLEEFKALADIWKLQKALLNKFKNIKVAFIILDATNQGCLYHQDFSSRLEAKGFPNHGATHENLFYFLDNNNDGKINLEDWNNGFRRIGERLSEIKEILAQNSKALPPGLLSPTLPGNSSFSSQSASVSLYASHAASENFKETARPNPILQINRSLTENTFERQNQITSPTSIVPNAFPMTNYQSPPNYRKFESQEDNVPHFGVRNSPYPPAGIQKQNVSNYYSPNSLPQTKSPGIPRGQHMSFFVGSPVSEDLEVSQEAENEHITKINFGAKVHEVPKVFVTSEHPLQQEAISYGGPHVHLQTQENEARAITEERLGSEQRLHHEERNWHLEQPTGENDLSGSKTLFDTRDMQGERIARSVATSLQGSVNDRRWESSVGAGGTSPVMERYPGVGLTNEREKSMEGRLAESYGYSEGRGFDRSKREMERDIEEGIERMNQKKESFQESMRREREERERRVDSNQTSGYKSVDNHYRYSNVNAQDLSSPNQVYASGTYSNILHKSNVWPETDMYSGFKGDNQNSFHYNNVEPTNLKMDSYNPEYTSHQYQQYDDGYQNKDGKYGTYNLNNEVHRSLSFGEHGGLRQAFDDKRPDLELKDLIDIPPNGATRHSGEIRHSEDLSSNVSSNENYHAKSVKESIASLHAMDVRPSKANHVNEVTRSQDSIESFKAPAQLADNLAKEKTSVVDMEREAKEKSKFEKNQVPQLEELDADIYSIPERLQRLLGVRQKTCNILLDNLSGMSAVRSQEHLREADTEEQDYHRKASLDSLNQRTSSNQYERHNVGTQPDHSNNIEEDYRSRVVQEKTPVRGTNKVNLTEKFSQGMPDITETEEANEVSVLTPVDYHKASESPPVRLLEHQNSRFEDQQTQKQPLQDFSKAGKREESDKLPLQMTEKVGSEGRVQLPIDGIRKVSEVIKENKNIENNEDKRGELISILERIEKSLQEDEERKKELKKLEGAKQKTELLRLQEKRLVSEKLEEDKNEKSFLSESSEKKTNEIQEKNSTQRTLFNQQSYKEFSRINTEEDRPLQTEEDMQIYRDDYWNLQVKDTKPKNQRMEIASSQDIERESTVTPSERSRGGSLQALDFGRVERQKQPAVQVQNVEVPKVNKEAEKIKENAGALMLKIKQEKEKMAEKQKKKKETNDSFDQMTNNINRFEQKAKNGGQVVKDTKDGRSIKDILKDLHELPLKKNRNQEKADLKTNSSFEDSILSVWERKLKRQENLNTSNTIGDIDSKDEYVNKRDTLTKESQQQAKGEKEKKRSLFDTLMGNIHKTQKIQDENQNGRAQGLGEKRSIFQESMLQTLKQKEQSQQNIPTKSLWNDQQNESGSIIHESFDSQKADPMISAFEPTPQNMLNNNNTKQAALKRIEGMLSKKGRSDMNISDDFSSKINQVRNMLSPEGKPEAASEWEFQMPKKRDTNLITESDKAKQRNTSTKTEDLANSEGLSGKLESLLERYENRANRKTTGLHDITNALEKQDPRKTQGKIDSKQDISKEKEKRDSYGSQTRGVRIETGNEDDLEAVRSLSSIMLSGRASFLPNVSVENKRTEHGDFTFLSRREESKDSNGVTSFPKSFLARLDDKAENGGSDGFIQKQREVNHQNKLPKEQTEEEIYKSLFESLGTFSLKVNVERPERPSMLQRLSKGAALKELINKKDLGGFSKTNLISELAKLEAVNKQLSRVNETLKKTDEDYWTI